ncbi:tRNA(Ile)-lysidine synthetase [hydrothermal vent metagenome]|uniref:tRNA(Ile)-lysidine synthetase n=1 Tax=hydrothermal vent metagenome TaxID=652676 RepID=A0A3B0R1Z9_9ZZZZ
MHDSLHLSPLEFSELMAPMGCSAGENLAAAVSGGADSLALTLMLGEWCRNHDISLTALTVDHGLRTEAAAEARQVADWLKHYDIAHVTLTWDGDKPHSNIQDQARRARYKLMGEWCRSHGVGQLFLGHHQDDQAETFLIRLFRGSGVDGLAAMKPQAAFPVSLPGMDTVCRPLLTVPKDRLKATLRHMGQAWIDDPSNEDVSYTRIKVRNLLAESGIEGLSVDRMAGTAARMGRVQSLLMSLTADLEREAVTCFPEGYAEVAIAPLISAHEEIALRCLAALLRRISGGTYAPRLTRLEALYGRLRAGDFAGQTLGGCLISQLSDNRIRISREAAGISETCGLGRNSTLIWDGRFVIKNGTITGHLKKIEQADWQQICHQNPALEKLKFAKVIRDSLPCIITDTGEVVLPNFIPGFEETGFQAKLKQHFVNDLPVK